MNKLFKSFAVISTVVGLGACASVQPSMNSEQHSYVSYVVERDMVVRQSANAGAKEVGQLSSGDTLTAWVEDVGGNWYRLHSDSGNVGYIFGRPFRVAE